MAHAYGRVERFHDDQLVVALPDLSVVTKALDGLGVRVGPDRTPTRPWAWPWCATWRTSARQSARLAAGHRHRAGARAVQAKSGPGLGAPTWLPSISWSRASTLQLAGSFPGWKVTIGKNYRPSLVKGYPHVSGGGDGDPEPTEATLRPARPQAGPKPQLGRGVRVGLLDTRMFPDTRLTGHYIAGPGDLLDPGQGSSRCSTGTARLSAPASCSRHRPPRSTCAPSWTARTTVRPGMLPSRWRKPPGPEWTW